MPQESSDRAAATRLASDPISIKQRTCQECGMLLDDGGEFHPYVFCVLKKAGCDPWNDLRWVTKQLGIELPERPPLVRDLSVASIREVSRG